MKRSNLRLSLAKCNLTKRQKGVIRRAWYKVRDEWGVESLTAQACRDLIATGTAVIKVPKQRAPMP